MIRIGEGKYEGQHGTQAPLFVCCSGCQAVLKAGCKVVCSASVIAMSENREVPSKLLLHACVW